MKLLHQPLAFVLPVVIAIATLTAGCQSTHHSESEWTASVVITNRSSEQIKAATREVFQYHQYEPARADDDELVFQKQGTFMNSFLSDDWFSGSVWERVKLYQHALDSERIQLDCDVYLVQSHEDPLFQKERKLGGHRSKYQALLEEIAENLNHQATAHEKRKLAAIGRIRTIPSRGAMGPSTEAAGVRPLGHTREENPATRTSVMVAQ